MENSGISCPRCGEAVPADKNVCPNCKKIITSQPQTAGVGPKLSNCPVCKLSIYPAKMGKYDILHCAECGSTAYKKEVLMKMQPLDPKKVEVSDMERGHVTPVFFEKREKPPFLICPFCMKKMSAIKLGQMQVDMCEECKAVFLDEGKEKHINDMLGPYKMKLLNNSRDNGRRGRR